MNKFALRITVPIILLAIVVIYGGKLFRSLAHSRKTFETNIYEYIPKDASFVVNFSRGHHFEEYFEIDTTNSFLIEQIKDYITYPLLIVKNKEQDDILLTRVTLEQEYEVERILKEIIAPYQSPKKVTDKDAKLNCYPLPGNKVIITMSKNGILAISTDYMKIKQLIDMDVTISNNIFSRDDETINRYVKKTYTNSPISMFIESKNTFYVLSYTKDQNIIIEGEYFGLLRQDSLKLSYNEMNNLLDLESHYTDSIQWADDDKLKVWINKAK